MTWRDLAPEPGILAALDHADGGTGGKGQSGKRNWSERFAAGCAVAIADGLRAEKRRRRQLARKIVRPESLAGGVEPITPLTSTISKKVDVTLTDPNLGLEIGFSLKGLNSPDDGRYGKNLTGRCYELSDEVRLIHRYLPRCVMVGIFFMPLEAAADAKSGPSTFARTFEALRERSGRAGSLHGEDHFRCDHAFVGLYCRTARDDIGRGACRFAPVEEDPPMNGRPKVGTTLSLESMVARVLDAATESRLSLWAAPETD
ncbi:MAG: hypothetical protein R6V44_14230 [Paracoccaceae bacterium]